MLSMPDYSEPSRGLKDDDFLELSSIRRGRAELVQQTPLSATSLPGRSAQHPVNDRLLLLHGKRPGSDEAAA